MRTIEIFIVRDTQHYIELRNKLSLCQRHVCYVTPNIGPEGLRGIESAVVWVMDDWWQNSYSAHYASEVWQTIMQIPDLDFVNYDRNFDLANL